jgi:hypothetical protein
MKPALMAVLLMMMLLLSSCAVANLTENAGRPTEIAEAEKEETEHVTEEKDMSRYDFTEFPNVTITGIDIPSLNETEQAILYAQAKYCQAMTDADIDTMRELVSEDMIYTHMSGMQQTREEYFADVADGSLRYYTIGIADPVIKVNGNKGRITYTSILNANAYGARGTFRMKGTHCYELRDGSWIAVNP